MASFVTSVVTAVDTSGASDTGTEGIVRLSTAIDADGGSCSDGAVFDWEI